jgi:hypothetical protein
MQLISYVKTVTNKRLLISESRSDSNRCTHCRVKSDIHDTYASRASPRTPHARFLRAVHVHGNLSLAINSVGWTLLLSRKRAPDTIHNTSVDRSTGLPPSFSYKTTIKAVMKAKYMLTTRYISLLGP